MNEAFEARLSEWKEQIDSRLSSIIKNSGYSDEFKHVLEYALFPGGKRLRPVLFLEWHSLFMPPDELALDFACGIEIMHSYSLIHDDMPCMDNDDLRRGAPTVHKQFGEGKALLAGDALLNLAYEVFIKSCCSNSNLLLRAVADLCGSYGLIKGQYSDLYESIDSVGGLLKMYSLKTAALIYLSCVYGYLFSHRNKWNDIEAEYALGNKILFGGESVTMDDLCKYWSGIMERGDERTLGDARDYWMTVLRCGDERMFGVGGAERFGYAFGIAFQIYDDVSEYINGEESDGTSILKFLNLEEAKLLLNNYLDDALSALDKYDCDTSYLRALVEKFVIL